MAGVFVEHLFAVDLMTITDGSHFAAAEHRALDDRAAGDRDGAAGNITSREGFVVIHIATAATEDVADAEVARQQVGAAGSTDLAAADVNHRHTVVDGVIFQTRQERGDFAVLVNTGEGQTTATVDGTLDGATVHGDVGVATHTTAVEVLGESGYGVITSTGSNFFTTTLSTAEDMAVP